MNNYKDVIKIVRHLQNYVKKITITKYVHDQ